MNQPLLSVIVPIYRTEAYLPRCVTSLLQQTYRNLEIILVDDGSPDNCGQLCDDFRKSDTRIRVIHKKNGGLSSARNAGLDVMTGEYVCFLDSDDWIESDMYESLYDLMQKHDAQIVACGMQCDRSDGSCYFFNPQYPKCKQIESYSKIQALRELIIAQKITNSACDKLFRAEIFENLRFQEGIVNEDFDLMYKCIELTSTVIYLPEPKYHYMMTDNSIMRGTFKESRFTAVEISRKNMKYFQEHYPDLYPLCVAKHVEICLGLIQATVYDGNVFPEKREQLIREVKSFEPSSFFSHLNWTMKLKYLMFALNTTLFLKLMTRYHNR